MDSIVVLDKGKLAKVGPYEQVRPRSANIIAQAEMIDDAASESVDETADVGGPPGPGTSELPANDTSSALDKNLKQRHNGSWSVYAYYARSAGVVPLIVWIVFTFVGAIGACYTSNPPQTS